MPGGAIHTVLFFGQGQGSGLGDQDVAVVEYDQQCDLSGVSGEGYSSNWILLVQGLMVPVVLLGIIWFVVPLYRKIIGLSTYEYFERRFGVFARYYSSLAFVLRQFSAMGTIFFLLALALRTT
ncbi:hypothetical protein ACQ86N_33200 [Puia sp. P3]|uniref:hypothetical protein n=1 Tax=Puia sp. P3 TaxID=3423952 RepID=UPI003D67FCBA